jgi:GH25 family lysozyme M1 (1,4-beta-N-acetylmuramidase)
MTTPQFVDISSFQGNIDFVAYAAWARQWDGIARIAMKSSEGTGFVDPLFVVNRAKALAAGIESIYCYHFARPDLGNSAIAEANWQHSVVGNVRDSDILILDYEVASPKATAEWANEWLVQQKANVGKTPAIYASSAYIQEKLQLNVLSNFSLWLANWQFTPDERPPVPAPWAKYEFVQYTDRATNVPGIAGTVDADIFLGVEITGNQEEPIMIGLDNGTVASHFSGDNNIWKCKDNGFLVGYGILGFYRKFGGDALCGLSYLGLPRSNELPVAGHAGVTQQEFERGAVRYDPKHVIDSPPGAGACYVIHVEQDPRQVALQSQITALQTQLSGNTLAQELAALQSKVTQAVKDLSS